MLLYLDCDVTLEIENVRFPSTYRKTRGVFGGFIPMLRKAN